MKSVIYLLLATAVAVELRVEVHEDSRRSPESSLAENDDAFRKELEKSTKPSKDMMADLSKSLDGELAHEQEDLKKITDSDYQLKNSFIEEKDAPEGVDSFRKALEQSREPANKMLEDLSKSLDTDLAEEKGNLDMIEKADPASLFQSKDPKLSASAFAQLNEKATKDDDLFAKLKADDDFAIKNYSKYSEDSKGFTGGSLIEEKASAEKKVSNYQRLEQAHDQTEEVMAKIKEEFEEGQNRVEESQSLFQNSINKVKSEMQKQNPGEAKAQNVDVLESLGSPLVGSSLLEKEVDNLKKQLNSGKVQVEVDSHGATKRS